MSIFVDIAKRWRFDGVSRRDRFIREVRFILGICLRLYAIMVVTVFSVTFTPLILKISNAGVSDALLLNLGCDLLLFFTMVVAASVSVWGGIRIKDDRGVLGVCRGKTYYRPGYYAVDLLLQKRLARLIIKDGGRQGYFETVEPTLMGLRYVRDGLSTIDPAAEKILYRMVGNIGNHPKLKNW